MAKNPVLINAKVLKLVHGGQGLCELEDGRKALVWGVLPGEVVEFVATKKKKDYLEGIVSEVFEPSKERVDPIETNYLSTSPWQIMNETKEGHYKTEIVKETFTRAGVTGLIDFQYFEPEKYFGYRNKMEYSFYGDEKGLHLALYDRGTHRKMIINSSKIAMPEIDKIAATVLSLLNKNQVRAGSLKTLILRSSQEGDVTCALFVKDKDFPVLKDLDNVCSGFSVIFSNPKSPASILTKKLYSFGDTVLSDKVLSSRVKYDVLSFFQVNVPEFRKALKSIKSFVKNDDSVDMFCGVGSIGIGVGTTKTYVDSDENNIELLRQNVGSVVKAVHARSEKALEYISRDALIVDPPRAGLHAAIIDRVIEVLPKKIAYLSCNPSTQARDIEMLSDLYKIKKVEIYNFFPRTPHIETLALLELK